jgi:hypothetical protein
MESQKIYMRGNTMTVQDAVLILRRVPQDAAERRVSHAALVVLGVEGIDLSTIEKSIERRLTLREEDTIYASAAWRAA